MVEIRAAYGLLDLQQVDNAIKARSQVAIRYRETLKDVDGITVWQDMPGVKHNYSYFPIFIDAKEYGMTRDNLYYKMRDQNILSRRYFYPLISSFSTYRGLPSASKENLPNAYKMAEEVICLPMHHLLSDDEIKRIINIIIN
jgi:dTDP-4-amino-4,6-dideoxygalactose transaminase